MKKIGWFIFDNMYLGRFAPYFFGWLIGAKPVKIEKQTKAEYRSTWTVGTTPQNEVRIIE